MYIIDLNFKHNYCSSGGTGRPAFAGMAGALDSKSSNIGCEGSQEASEPS